VFILKVSSVEEARALAAPDPAIQQGRLVLELHPWFAAAGAQKEEIPSVRKSANAARTSACATAKTNGGR